MKLLSFFVFFVFFCDSNFKDYYIFCACFHTRKLSLKLHIQYTMNDLCLKKKLFFLLNANLKHVFKMARIQREYNISIGRYYITFIVMFGDIYIDDYIF